MSLLCPSCNVDLVMSDRQGIEIDYCPKCRGVWLDRGELDKILERAAGPSHAPAQAPPMVAPGAANASLFGRAPPQAAQSASTPTPHRDAPYPQDGYRDDRRRYRDDDDDDDDRRKYGHGHKRKSWLSDIFD